MTRLFKFLLLLLLSDVCFAQTPVTLSPQPIFQAWNTTGSPLAFGCVFTYQSKTQTNLTTYTDQSGQYPNTNPVILDASGRANIWIQTGQAYTYAVKTSGGTNCSLGTTLYTVDGIGGGGTQLTTVVTPSAGSATFTDQAQNQLFQLTLTGNVTSLPMTATGIIPPGTVTFEITQDAAGGHTFSWPSNVLYAAPVCSTSNCVTQESFVWNGSNAIAIGAASFSTPAAAVPNLFDFGLLGSSLVCTNASFELSTSCNGISAVTYNGQPVGLNGTGNVNAGAATHSVALNEGAGNAIAGLPLGANQIPVGQAGADPVASTIPTCPGGIAFSGTLPLTCASSAIPVQVYTRQELSGDVSVSANVTTTLTSTTVTMPASGCPCRAQVSWSIGLQTGSAGGFTAAINDGTDTFAAANANATGSVGGNAQVGLSASGWSHQLYANGANVTFVLRTRSSDTGFTVNKAFSEGIVQNSGMDITIFASN